jgi:hypothetical protein
MTPFASAPALPLHTAGPYVAAAYIVLLAVVLLYVTIMGRRLMRNQRELVELRKEIEVRDAVEGSRNSIADSAGAEPADIDAAREVAGQP